VAYEAVGAPSAGKSGMKAVQPSSRFYFVHHDEPVLLHAVIVSSGQHFIRGRRNDIAGHLHSLEQQPRGRYVAKSKKNKSSVTLDFDIDDPKLPDWIEESTLKSDNFPYDRRMKRRVYEEELVALQIELAKLQVHALKTGIRIVALFEGRDSAGKGSCIKRFMEYINPRHAHAVALPKPTDREQGEWYFQRYAAHLPTAGEIVLFDRSWYNRAGVERVMGFCTDEELADFLREAPQFESMLVRDDIYFFKFYLSIGRETQLKRFHDRRHSPLKHWKISPIDMAALSKWDDYTIARDEMLRLTHTPTCPWTVVLANDKRRARLDTIRAVLSKIDYEGNDHDIVGLPDPKILIPGNAFLER
jgi:polyphosphate kinase 2